jgi:zinc transporter 9
MKTMSHGTKSTVYALIGNTIVTIIKLITAILTGSASMVAESVHSSADTLNQSLLLIGIKRSKKPADKMRGYGYGIERFFWSLISACGILFIGAGVTVYHSITKLTEDNIHSAPQINYITILVLVIAFIIEGFTLRIALKELAGKKKITRKVLENADPVTLAVVYEDGAAVIGVLIAMLAQALAIMTGDIFYDALGGLLIGILLGVLAILLIIKNHQYIIGKSIDKEIEEDIIELLLKDPCIEQVLEFKSNAVDVGKYRIFATVEWNGSPLYEDIYESGDLKEEFEDVKDDFKKFAKLMFRTIDRVPRLVGNHTDDIEKEIQKKFPQVAYVDIEIN